MDQFALEPCDQTMIKHWLWIGSLAFHLFLLDLFGMDEGATFSGQNIQMTIVVPCFKVKVAYLCQIEGRGQLLFWAHEPKQIKATVLFRSLSSSPHTTNKPTKEGSEGNFLISEVSDVEVQVCTAHNALIISQPGRLGTTLHLLPAPFYFPEQYGSEVLFRKNCVDAQSHSSEAAALKTWRRAQTE